jgi:hypothetical protein
MAVNVTFPNVISKLDTTQSTQVVRGSITLTGSYVAGGDAFSLAKTPVQSKQRPIRVIFWEEPASGTNPTGLEFYYRNVSTSPNATNGVLQITGPGTGSTGAAGAEFTAGAYSAALLATIIKFEAVFPLGQ